MVNTILARRVNHIVAKEDNPVWPKGSKSRGFSSKLESHGILYVGDLIQLNEEYLMEIWGLGPVALERIKTKLNENGVWFGMDVIRINDRWYRRKQELTTD